MKYLLTMGADVNTKNVDGWTSLHGAAVMGLVKTYQVPISGKGKYWHVFSYNGSTGLITTINKIGTSIEI